jgi:hypothetical protein
MHGVSRVRQYDRWIDNTSFFCLDGDIVKLHEEKYFI